MTNQTEKEKCPMCEGRGKFRSPAWLGDGMHECPECKGTGFVSRSFMKSPEADRSPRNAPDRASLSVGGVMEQHEAVYAVLDLPLQAAIRRGDTELATTFLEAILILHQEWQKQTPPADNARTEARRE